MADTIFGQGLRPVPLKLVAGNPTPDQTFGGQPLPVQIAGLSTVVASSLAAKAQIAALTAITTADATDPASVITLANANKAKINAIIAALKA